MGFFSRKVEVPEEIKAFNHFSPEQEKLLCIGAAVTQFSRDHVGSKPGDLKLFYPDKKKKNMIKYWLPMFNIHTEQNAVQLVNDWLAANRYDDPRSEETMWKVQREITKAAKKYGLDPMPMIDVSKEVTNSGAFNLERLGYIIRVCFSLELLTEQQTWDFLTQLHKIAVQHYSSWDEYVISYTNENEEQSTSWYKDILKDYLKIKQEAENIYDLYPLQK